MTNKKYPLGAKILGWRRNTTNEPIAISKLLLVVRTWIDEQNKINNLLSINNQIKLKPKPNYGKILKNRLYNIMHGKRLMFTY